MSDNYLSLNWLKDLNFKDTLRNQLVDDKS